MGNDDRLIRGPQEADERILVPSERVLTRNAGCWNCKFARDANEFWFGDKTKGTLGRRNQELTKALVIATEHRLGEQHPKVRNIRRMVQVTDEAVTTRAMLQCGGGYDKSDLVANSFMCDRYVGATGASVARGGERINDLAEELREKIDGPESNAKIEELVADMKKGDEQ